MARAAIGVSVFGERGIRAKGGGKKGIRFMYLSFLAVTVTVAVVSLYLWSRLKVVDIGYEISRLNEARAALLEKNRRLRFELTELKSPQRVEKIGAEMGLAYPKGGQVINIK
ncbi:MAG: cell division protein FtsL [Deltaproteobacteria bacterium]|nr:cell division protein FtsL [Deltaproteobacteria bacterium]